jgi:tetratricopeptide (TPR) repeat protein
MTQIQAPLTSSAIGGDALGRRSDGERPRLASAAADWARGPGELRGTKSIVLDQVLSEYRERTAAGEEVRKGEFCERFPQYQSAILHQLEVEDAFIDLLPQFAVEDEPLRWPKPGQTFLGYEIVEQIGRGGVALVFLAREQAIGRRYVVIKVSPFGTREPHRLGRLSHPSIMPILSVHRDHAGWMVICMPLVGLATGFDLIDGAFHCGHEPIDGRIVAQVAREAGPKTKIPPPPHPAADEAWRVPWDEAIARIGLQLADALAAAHAAGILHRDIKPSNILLDWSARPLLLDFNLATDDGAEFGGTPAYMAPERLERMLASEPAAARFESNCDLYSLGAVLHQLLSGQEPVKARERSGPPTEEDLRALLAARRKPLVPLTGGRTQVDSRLEAIVLKCLAASPADRYQSASDLAADLRAWLSRTARAVRAVRRNRRSVLLGAVALSLSGVGLGSYIGNRPSYLNRLYRQGIDDYEQGRFDKAAGAFSRCLEIRPGWADALFGRAQAFRRQRKWHDARTDFLSLQPTNKAWSYAMAGYCGLAMKDNNGAWGHLETARREGLRDIEFLLNSGVNFFRLRHYLPAVSRYSEVLAIDPEHRIALRNRALTYAALVRETNAPLKPEALRDIEKYVEMEDSFLGPFAAAKVYHEAALLEPHYDTQAVRYFERALEQGAPIEWVQGFAATSKTLLLISDWDLVGRAVHDPSCTYDFYGISEPPLTAAWDEFSRLKDIAPRSASFAGEKNPRFSASRATNRQATN